MSLMWRETLQKEIYFTCNINVIIFIHIVVYLQVISLVRKRLLSNTHVLKTRTPVYMWTYFEHLCAKEVGCDCLALRYNAIFPTEFEV